MPQTLQQNPHTFIRVDRHDALADQGIDPAQTFAHAHPGPHRPLQRQAAAGRMPGLKLLREHGQPLVGQRAPIFFTVDDDINRDTWNTVALQWFRGINSVLGVQRTGVYGGINVCQWAATDGVIGNSRTPGHRWAWQPRSWSRGQIAPAAVLYQRVVSTASNPGPVVGGLEVDV